jgi:hypothetical protein
LTYQITYIKNNEQLTIEWIVPPGWTQQSIRDAFHTQYPAADILTIEAKPC